MTSFRPLLHATALLLALVATPTLAATGGNATTIDLSAEATRPASNDLARATVFAEATGATAGELADQVKRLIGDALKATRAYGSIKTQSGATSTYPVYGKGSKIEGWRMRSELTLESTDTAALSELLGKLQASLGVANLSMLPAPETRKKTESEAIVDALAAFKARAKVVADAMGRDYRIKHLSITSDGQPPAPRMMRSAAMASAEAAPMPIEAGDSQIRATVAGQIELLD
ncbi:MAG: SIMPL domain-containing protein [Candidatus Accumulibacter sp.]|nr:SIMPL domain-containing protein [Accumulibacter sp.]